MRGSRQLISNSLSLVLNRLTQSLTTFILVAAIARLRGPYELGQYTLAFSYYFVFMTLVSQGFKTLFTRELSQKPSETPIYLISGTILQLLFGFLGYIGLVITIFLLPYKPDTSMVCYILGLMIFPFSLSNVTEAIFQAQEKMHLIALSTVPIYILRIFVIIAGMNQGDNILKISGIIVISEVIILILQWIFAAQITTPIWSINWEFIKRIIRAAWTFMAIDGIPILKARMQILILSLLGGEVLVGIYGALTQLMQPFEIVSSSLALAVFPKLSKAVEQGKTSQRNLVETVIQILLSVALPFVVGVFFIGSDLLSLVYQNPEFSQVGLELRILSLGIIFVALIRPLSFVLVANGLERINLLEVMITTGCSVVISMILVSQYELMGAALSVLLLQIIACGIYSYAVYVYVFPFGLWKTLGRPLLISLFMLILFLISRHLQLTIIWTLIGGTVAYVCLAAIFGLYAVGGPR